MRLWSSDTDVAVEVVGGASEVHISDLQALVVREDPGFGFCFSVFWTSCCIHFFLVVLRGEGI